MKKEISGGLKYIVIIRKAGMDADKLIAKKEKEGTAKLAAGYIVVEYKGRLTEEAKYLGIEKGYNAYGRRCNILFTMTTNSNIEILEEAVAGAIKAFCLEKDYAVTSGLL